jgi:hypothetical protein
MNIKLIAAMINATDEERLAAIEIEYFAKTARLFAVSGEHLTKPGTLGHGAAYLTGYQLVIQRRFSI